MYSVCERKILLGQATATTIVPMMLENAY